MAGDRSLALALRSTVHWVSAELISEERHRQGQSHNRDTKSRNPYRLHLLAPITSLNITFSRMA
jgi:hypothetical protein